MKYRFTGPIRFLLCCIILAALAATQGYAQMNRFQETYGDSLSEEGKGVTRLSQGGYVTVGTISDTSDNDWESDIYVVKVSPCGSIEWKQRYDVAQHDFGVKIRQTSDGGYLVLGNVELTSPCFNRLDILLMKLDASGAVQWARTYGGMDVDEGTDLQLHTTHGHLCTIVGTTGSFGNGGVDGLILLIDQGGYIVWGKTLGGTSNDHFTACHVLGNGDIIVTGLTLSGTRPGAMRLLVAVFAMPFGNLIAPFPMAYGNQIDPVVGLSVVFANGQIVVAGSRSIGNRTSAYLLQTQNNGMYINDRTFNSTNPLSSAEFRELMQDPAGLAMVGTIVDPTGGFGGADMLVVRTDQMLVPTLRMLHGGTGSDIGSSIAGSSSGPGLVLAGSTNSFGFGQEDMYLVHQDVTGFTGCHDAVPLLEMSTPGITGSPIQMQLSNVRIGCDQQVNAADYGDRYRLCDECPEEQSSAPADPEFSSLPRDVRATSMLSR